MMVDLLAAESRMLSSINTFC